MPIVLLLLYNIDMTVKQAAGKILLALYLMQTQDPIGLRDEQINFSLMPDSKQTVGGSDKIESMLKKLKLEDDAVVYNAFHYLLEKDLVTHINSRYMTMGSEFYNGPKLTAFGIDIIEGVEQKDDEPKKNIKALFNFEFKNNTITVDSLLKAQVGDIIGAGGKISL